MRTIKIVAYDPAWPVAFRRLQEQIKDRIGDLILEIHHIGSTAVPGLCAKPKIDIDALVKSEIAIAEAVQRVNSAGYFFHGDRYGNGMWSFTRSHGVFGERLYLCLPGNPIHADRLRFRDYLRDHPEMAAAYGDLKRRLSNEADGDWDHYTAGKGAFVAEILRLGAILPETDRKQADGRRPRAQRSE